MTPSPTDARPQQKGLPIRVRQVSKTYGRAVALDQVDLDVQSGEFLTLLGPSGSGKTTLLMVLAGFVRPNQGSLHFGERDVLRLAPHKRGVGMVFQSYALFPHLTVAENIAFPLKLRRVPRPEAMRRVEAVLDLVQLPDFGGRGVDALSGGQRQRVALARAIVFEPGILLMDEPLSALDKQLRERMQIELRALHDRLGITTVCVTHDQREALTMSNRIAVIDRGSIIQLGTPKEIYDRPSTRFVADFIGESTFLPVTGSGGTFRLGAQALKLEGYTPPPGANLLMLRPERLALLPEGAPGPDPRYNVITGRVTDIVYQGESVLVQIRLDDGGTVAARVSSARAALGAVPVPGASARLAFAPEDMNLLCGEAG
ncbi:ABC transporter ATP-binding protein [Solirhodobacter olei]|uniref:ABC transporter ATP-binding protein n=1 Tax=Solirhodobacter olei TaxID=2493082 RepID=UPI000FDAC55C|nr:ABC transporter ATP-binding protein [Solirhodobacter olei]